MNPDVDHHSTLAAETVTFTGRGGKVDWLLSTRQLRICAGAVRSAQLRICAAARRTFREGRR